MGDIGGLFESMLLIGAVVMKIFGTNFLDLHIVERMFKTSSVNESVRFSSRTK